MSILATCSNCGKEYRLSDHLGGKKAKCKQCGVIFEIPLPAAVLEEEPTLEEVAAPVPAPAAVRPAQSGPRAARAAAVEADDAPQNKEPSTWFYAMRALLTVALVAGIAAGAITYYIHVPKGQRIAGPRRGGAFARGGAGRFSSSASAAPTGDVIAPNITFEIELDRPPANERKIRDSNRKAAIDIIRRENVKATADEPLRVLVKLYYTGDEEVKTVGGAGRAVKVNTLHAQISIRDEDDYVYAHKEADLREQQVPDAAVTGGDLNASANEWVWCTAVQRMEFKPKVVLLSEQFGKDAADDDDP